jgi:hypothetical protein
MPSWFGGRGDASRPEGTSPQELIALMRSYLVQETVGPLRRLLKSLALGVGGAAAFGVGGIIVLVGLLRLLQTETGGAFFGNWSFAPYLITAAGGVALIGLAVMFGLRSGRDDRHVD